MVGRCEHGNDLSGLHKTPEFLYCLRNCLPEDSGARGGLLICEQSTAFLLPFHRERQFLTHRKSSSAEAVVVLGTAVKETQCVTFKAKSIPPKLTFCPDVKASSAGTDQNTNKTQYHTNTDGHQRCRATVTAAARKADLAAAQSVGRPARRGNTISAPLSASCATSLAPAPVPEDRGSRLPCIEGNRCDNNDKDFFERTSHQLNLITVQQMRLIQFITFL